MFKFSAHAVSAAMLVVSAGAVANASASNLNYSGSLGYANVNANTNTYGSANVYNQAGRDTIRRISVNQLVSAFDSIAKMGGEIILLNSSGKVDLSITIGTRDASSVVGVLAEKSKSVTVLDTYAGLVNGQRATLVRSGNELGISWVERRSGRILLREFTKNGPEKIHRLKPMTSASLGNDVIVDPHVSDRTSHKSVVSAPNNIVSARNNPINFWVFMHNDLSGRNPSAYHAGYFSWFINHLKEIMPGEKINLYFASDADIEKMDYMADNDAAQEKFLISLSNKVSVWKDTFKRQFNDVESRESIYGNIDDKGRNKFLLFTNRNPNYGEAGFAIEGGDVGVASDDNYQVAAHEFGHMIGATHENARVNYNGWWCETIMSSINPIHSNCYYFSEKNKELIRRYYSFH